jgi:hypothetical protein
MQKFQPKTEIFRGKAQIGAESLPKVPSETGFEPSGIVGALDSVRPLGAACAVAIDNHFFRRSTTSSSVCSSRC